MSTDRPADAPDARLLIAAQRGDAEALRTALRAGASTEARSASGETALMYAAASGDDAACQILIAAGAQLGARDPRGSNAADYARRAGHHDLAAHLDSLWEQHSHVLSADEEAFLRSALGNRVVDQAKAYLAGQKLGAPSSEGVDRSTKGSNPPQHEEPKSAAPAAEIKAEDLVGQHAAKTILEQVIAMSRVNLERSKRGLPVHQVTLHAVFSGNPGTGKTTFARYYAQEIRKLGVLKKGHLVEIARQDLVAEYMGQTATKTAQAVERALGGVLFIDEAYSLKQSKEDMYGQEAIDTLIKLMEDKRNDLILILAGYTDEMRNFLHLNPGLKSRIPNLVPFDDFTDEELGKIFDHMARKAGVEMSAEVRQFALKEIVRRRRGRYFGNGREVRNILERALAQQSARLSKLDLGNLSHEELVCLTQADFAESTREGTEAVDAAHTQSTPSLAKLDALQGLAAVKREIHSLADFLRISQLRQPGKPAPLVGLNMAFLGNAGTGKSTVARLLGQIYRELGVLASGHLVEVGRGDLVAGYSGQTAIKTRDRFLEALGGVLVVDEAGSLADDGYGQEAIDTLLQLMAEHEGGIGVILTGERAALEQLFVQRPALQAALARVFYFDDLSDKELVAIAEQLAGEHGYRLTSDAAVRLAELLQAQRRRQTLFGNARSARALLEQALRRHATRLMTKGETLNPDDAALHELSAEDFV